MKVLMLSWEFPPHVNGGMGEHVRALVPALLERDPTLDLHIITPTFDGQTMHERRDRLTVHRVDVFAPLDSRIHDDVMMANVRLARAAADVIRSEGGFDFIHVHDWLVSFAALALQDIHKIPILTTIHATERGRHRGGLYNDLSRAIDAAEGRLVRRSQQVITCSNSMQQEVQDFFGAGPDNLHIIANGIDSRRFHALRKQDLSEFRARYARPDEKIVFNVGRLVYEKGADLLVEAAPRVLQQAPEAKFVIGGRGPLLAGLEQRVQELRLGDKVLLAGFLNDADRDRLYVVSDCCAFPSRYEPFGIVALEAMAARTPVVVSNVGGLGTVVSHGITGLTTYPENIDSLAWGILNTLKDPEAAQRRALQAWNAVEQTLSWPVIADETLQVYRLLVEESQRRAWLPRAEPLASQAEVPMIALANSQLAESPEGQPDGASTLRWP